MAVVICSKDLNGLRPTERLAVWWVLPGVTQVKQARWSLFTHCQLSTEIIKWLNIIWACAIGDPVVHPTKK